MRGMLWAFRNQPLAERSKLGRAAFEIASERGTGNRQVFGTPRGGSALRDLNISKTQSSQCRTQLRHVPRIDRLWVLQLVVVHHLRLRHAGHTGP
jgi:hypothetical protein